MAVRAWPIPLELPNLDRRMIVSGLLAAVAAVIVLVMTQPPERVPVLVAGSDLPAGTALADLDIEIRYVEAAEGMVEGTSVGDLGPWMLATSVGEGEPLLPSLLRPPAMTSAPNLLAITLGAEHAVLGQLHPGDIVDVYVTSSPSPTKSHSTELVAADVYVVSAVIADDAVRRGDVDILLAVNDDLAALLTAAARTGGIDLVKVGP
ncbi:MAG: RcpC/CpaB family pilus assembly protein [Acidimicrobiia bacterium]